MYASLKFNKKLISLGGKSASRETGAINKENVDPVELPNNNKSVIIRKLVSKKSHSKGSD